VTLIRALVRNLRPWSVMLREKAQAAKSARLKVPMHRSGSDCSIVVMKRGNARGAKGAGHRHWRGSTGNGRNPMFNGRRQPPRGGTSRMTRECQVRICERLGVQFPGPTRQFPGPTRQFPGPTRQGLPCRRCFWGMAASPQRAAGLNVSFIRLWRRGFQAYRLVHAGE